jgi:DNA-binding CsgD family transcriptional regulator
MTEIDALRATARAAGGLRLAKTTEELVESALPASAAFGVHSLSVVQKPAAGGTAVDAILFSNVSQTEVAKYRSRGYAAVDPIVQRPLRGDGSRRLSAIAEERLSALERKVFGSYHCAAGVTDGLVIPVRRSVHPDGVIVFGGVAPNLSEPAAAALTVLGHCLYARLLELRAAPDAPSQPALSPRAVEVLSWVAKGKSDGEIATILSMSARTVRFHVANAKARLGTATRIQAVTQAIALGLIEG